MDYVNYDSKPLKPIEDPQKLKVQYAVYDQKLIETCNKYKLNVVNSKK